MASFIKPCFASFLASCGFDFFNDFAFNRIDLASAIIFFALPTKIPSAFFWIADTVFGRILLFCKQNLPLGFPFASSSTWTKIPAFSSICLFFKSHVASFLPFVLSFALKTDVCPARNDLKSGPPRPLPANSFAFKETFFILEFSIV